VPRSAFAQSSEEPAADLGWSTSQVATGSATQPTQIQRAHRLPHRRYAAAPTDTHTVRTETGHPVPETGRFGPKTGASGPKSGLGDWFLSVENGPRLADLRTKHGDFSTKGRFFGAWVCVFVGRCVCFRGAGLVNLQWQRTDIDIDDRNDNPGDVRGVLIDDIDDNFEPCGRRLR